MYLVNTCRRTNAECRGHALCYMGHSSSECVYGSYAFFLNVRASSFNVHIRIKLRRMIWYGLSASRLRKTSSESHIRVGSVAVLLSDVRRTSFK